MKKILGIFAMVGFALMLATACGSTAETNNSDVTMVSPLCESGTLIAEIGDSPCYYNAEYLFKMGYLRYNDTPAAGDKEYLLELELSAMAARDEGITVSDEEVSNALAAWQSYAAETQDLIASLQQQAGSSSEQNNLPLAHKKKDFARYQELLQTILKKENLTEEEFWAKEEPYIRKGLTFTAFGEKNYEKYESLLAENPNADQLQFIKETMNEMKERYQVTLK